MAGIGGVDDVDALDVGLKLLHDPLENPLRAGAMHLDLDSRVRGLEEFGPLLRAGEDERGVPDDLALLLGRLQTGVLGAHGGGEDEARYHEDDGHDASQSARVASEPK